MMRTKSILKASALSAFIVIGCGSRVQYDAANHPGGSAGVGGASNAIGAGAPSGHPVASSSNHGGTGGAGDVAQGSSGNAGVGGRAGAPSITGGSGNDGRPSAGAPNFGGGLEAGGGGAVDDPSRLGACPSVADDCRTCTVQQCSLGVQECGYSEACMEYFTLYLSCGNDGHRLPGRLILCLSGGCGAACLDKVM